MSTQAPDSIEHARRCPRRRPPILRATWNQAAEYWCPECGRTRPAVREA